MRLPGNLSARNRKRHRGIWPAACLAVAIGLVALPVWAQSTQEASEAELSWQMHRTLLSRQADKAIGRGVKFLLSQQNADGSWGAGDDKTDAGCTALVTLALLSCDQSYQSPPLDAAIKFLKRVHPQKSLRATYSIALRACVYAQLPEPLRKDELRADLRWLQESMIDRPERRGLYDYNAGRVLGGDYSNSQYGVLGVWYAAMAGLEVPRSYWKRAEDGWRNGQNPDGGWGYMPTSEDPDGPERFRRASDSYASMTAAGAATLYITNDYLHARDSVELNRININKPLEQAMNWLAENFAVDANVGKDVPVGQPRARRRADNLLDLLSGVSAPGGTYLHYMLFGYERVGEASGLTRFGPHKWFDEGADFLVRSQMEDGSWAGSYGGVIDTAYSLLFLSRGRAPVVIQKLQFEGHWNNRSRDAAAVALFMRRATERHVNWQVVSIDAAPDELRESSLLYAASDRWLKLNAEQKARLRAYLEQGGLLVCANEGRADDFAQSIVAIARELFPAWQFRDLPRDHPIYTANFPVTVPAEPIRGLTNGVRELIVLFPNSDMSWKWQSTGGGFDARHTPYAPLANLVLYANDRSAPRRKGEDTWVDRDPGLNPIKTFRVARIKYDGNWDPEPAGWQRLSNILWNLDDLDLRADSALPLDQCEMAYLTATSSVQLSEPLQQSLRNYLDHGGLLLLDAAGGSSEAAGSFDSVIRELYPKATFSPLPLDHPLYHAKLLGGMDIDHVDYRHSPDLQPIHVPRLRAASVDGKLIAIVSYEDLSGGLVGYSTGGLNGYTSASATELVRNIILWRAGTR